MLLYLKITIIKFDLVFGKKTLVCKLDKLVLKLYTFKKI